MLCIVNCKCNSQIAPLGIDTPNPAFSWQLITDERNVLQKSFHVVVTTGENLDKIVWDSSKVNSDNSIAVVYLGLPLKSCSEYAWFVEVEDSNGKTVKSGLNHFGTAFMQKGDWSARWISPNSRPLPKEKKANMAMAMLFPPKKLPDMIPCSMLHKQFIATDGIKRVRVYATAHGVYRLFINGQRVDDCELAPEFSVYPKVLFYQTYDATALVESGKNAIGVILADGWCCGHIGMSGSS
ncbi:MAG: alpha-L-rhamnosidase N-terminal domain-containing protein, partial [Clostridiales bacterium]|nr:alpha-L-rhamnosidase N-terminal domain-containing protein [Clostridiales bacterium]